MNKRWHGPLIVALILLLGAAFAIFTAGCVMRPLSIISERVILDDRDSSVLWPSLDMSLSPDGRRLLFCRNEPKQGIVFFLLDLETARQIKLPFPPLRAPYVDPLMRKAFTADGNYIYGIESDGTTQGPERPWALLYDIRNGVLKTIKAGPCEWIASDDRGENLLVTTRGASAGAVKNLEIVSLSGGPTRRYRINGWALGTCGEGRTIILSPVYKPGTLSFTGASLSIVDLPGERMLKMFSLMHFNLPCTLFRTEDDRFLCYLDMYFSPNFPAMARNRISTLLPFVGRSPHREVRDGAEYFIWDSASDHLTNVRGSSPIALGPSPHSLLMIRGRRFIVRDLATGREYLLPQRTSDTFIRAFGKYVISEVDIPEGGRKFILVEIALPAGSK